MVTVDEAKMPFLDCLHYNHADQYCYKEATRIACKERNIPYLDVFKTWMTHGEAWVKQRLSEDGLHPNILGYQTLLEDVASWKALSSIVNPLL